MKPYKFKILGWYIYYGEYGFVISRCPRRLLDKLNNIYLKKGELM